MASWTTPSTTGRAVNPMPAISAAGLSNGVSSSFWPPARAAACSGVTVSRIAVASSARRSCPFLSPSSSRVSFSADRGHSSAVQPCPCLRAKRRPEGSNAGQEEEELDEDLRAGLNEISTEALKAMLSGDYKLLDVLKDKVDYLGEYLVQEKQFDAAKFMLVIRGMLNHEVDPQTDDLKGAYKKAFERIVIVIEDSGWILKKKGDDIGGVEMVDDELIPPVLGTQY